MSNNFAHSHTFAKHCPLNKEKYSTLLFQLIQEFQKRFQDFRQNQQLFLIFATLFSVDINILHPDFQMKCIEVQSDIQLKEKFNNSLYSISINYIFPKKNIPASQSSLFMSSLFGSTYICEQLFSRMN